MDDRDLLERAAKAIDCKCMPGNRWDGACGYWLEFGDEVEWWNPLEDDGDAFWLMHAIRADTHRGENEHGEGIITVLTEEGCWADAPTCEEYDIAGLRRAIVRAAAAMAGGES